MKCDWADPRMKCDWANLRTQCDLPIDVKRA